MKTFSLALLITFMGSPVFACQLPKGEKILIGCSKNCDILYRLRLSLTGMYLGYKLKFTELQTVEDLARVDAVIMPGGADIDPDYYLDSISQELRDYTLEHRYLAKITRESRRRDPFEYELVKRYSSDDSFKKLPMLGICRGMQMMAVGQGIPLYLDIKTELGIKNRRNLFDLIQKPVEGSLLRDLYGERNFYGFKLHHQGIRVNEYSEDKYPLTQITAYSHQGRIAEGLEYKHRPALGVQYHPEKSLTNVSVPVFRWLLKNACEYKKNHKESL